MAFASWLSIREAVLPVCSPEATYCALWFVKAHRVSIAGYALAVGAVLHVPSRTFSRVYRGSPTTPTGLWDLR